LKGGEMRRPVAGGFSLVENVFSAMIIAIVILGMSTAISTYTVSQQKTKDRPFALNLGQQQMDEVMVNLVTQNAMVFDNAPNPRGRSFFLKSENMTVSQYFFNNFPLNAPVDPVGAGTEMAAIPWTTVESEMDTKPIPADIADKVYNGSNAYIKQTLFYRNRFYRAGGELVGNQPSEYPSFEEVKAELRDNDANPPKYVVRFQLFGIPTSKAPDPNFNIGSDIRASVRLASGQFSGDPRDPPAGAPFLIGDSCISASNKDVGAVTIDGATGRIYLRERKAAAADNPDFFPHMTSKVLVARVYRITDYSEDGTFFMNGGVPDTEIASSSTVLVGRVQRK
jgi:type II secretory pathway pseudopilin PulG